MVVGHGYQEDRNPSTCPTISRMTVTLLTSQSTPTATDADALVIGMFQGTDGPVPVPDIDDIDLMAALTALGATGKPEELTKIPTGGRLATPVVVAVGLGAAPGTAQDPAERLSYLERLRRAAGAATRELTSGRARRIAVALPAGEPDEAEAVTLGALLGGRLMHWIDLAGAMAAHRHSRNYVVTAAIDHMDFWVPVHVGDLVILRSSVNRVFRSSMEVGVKAWVENYILDDCKHVSSAYLTFVAVDAGGRCIQVPAVIPETEDQRRRYDDAGKRRQMRREHLERRASPR